MTWHPSALYATNRNNWLPTVLPFLFSLMQNAPMCFSGTCNIALVPNPHLCTTARNNVNFISFMSGNYNMHHHPNLRTVQIHHCYQEGWKVTINSFKLNIRRCHYVVAYPAIGIYHTNVWWHHYRNPSARIFFPLNRQIVLLVLDHGWDINN